MSIYLVSLTMLIIPLHKNTKFFVCAKFRAQNRSQPYQNDGIFGLRTCKIFSKVEGLQVVGRCKYKLSIINSLYAYFQIHENELISDLQNNIDDKHL